MRRLRTLADFGAEYVLPAPAMAHSARRTVWYGEPASATDHRIPERSDRNTAE